METQNMVKNIRSVESLSMMNPLMDGDFIELEDRSGSFLFKVRRGGYGWQLIRVHDGALHQTILDIDGMADFINAILEWSKAYS